VLGSVQNCVDSFLERHPMPGVSSDRVVYFDVTNRKIDGSCYLYFAEDERSPVLVAKAARTKLGQEVFRIEYDNLEKLHALGMNDPAPTTPAPLGRWQDGDTLVTLQSALEGELMKNVPGSGLFSATNLEGTVAQVLNWWRRLQRLAGTHRVKLTDEVYTKRVLDPVELFGWRYRLRDDEYEVLDRRFGRERRLAGAELPFMVRHGDFCAANLVLQPHGIGVFDWEFPLEHHTPLFDLFFFYSSVRFPHGGRRGESPHSASFVEVYWGDSYFSRSMRRDLDRICGECAIDRSLLDDLFLLSLVQTANMKYEGLITSHGMPELAAPVAQTDKAARWKTFERPDKDAPFAHIRDGAYENLRQVVRCGLPGFSK
jgi:hypothetical protein